MTGYEGISLVALIALIQTVAYYIGRAHERKALEHDTLCLDCYAMAVAAKLALKEDDSVMPE